MKRLFVKSANIILTVLLLAAPLTFNALAEDKPQLKTEPIEQLLQPSREKSLKAFETVMAVLKDPRCINCHPVGDRPMQGDDNRLHGFGVERERNCNACHGEENKIRPDIPGAPHWALAPRSMGWYGLSDVEIGKRLLDMEMNRNRTPADLVHHMTNDALVLWGWQPGVSRKPVQVPFDEFELALHTWLENGAHIPLEE